MEIKGFRQQHEGFIVKSQTMSHFYISIANHSKEDYLHIGSLKLTKNILLSIVESIYSSSILTTESFSTATLLKQDTLSNRSRFWGKNAINLYNQVTLKPCNWFHKRIKL